jgi:Tfp pilus assembly protein PilZ
LGNILDCETSSQISFASFIDHYLRLLELPSDVIKVLENGDINLFEAEQFARVTEKRLGITPAEAKRKRTDLLAAHLQTKASGERLRRRVNEMLGASSSEARASSEADNVAQEWGI